MLEQSKFTGALAKLTPRPTEQGSRDQKAQAATIDAAPERGKGRPPGKRSDPDFQPTTVLLRKQTKKMAARLLEDADAKKDLSDLIEELLCDWMKKQT